MAGGNEAASARRWALQALTRRMHTTREIRTGLERRGFDRDVIDGVVAGLVRLKYVDDRQFAEVWISSRSALRLHGRLRLARDLKQKGVSEKLIREAMELSLTVEAELEFARKAAEKKVRNLRSAGPRARAALYRHLSSRGFTADVVRAVLDDIDLEEKLS
ncbi:MAG: regulatory protein RecX [bacterium]|nr:regulatory protein RecX [bacterium]MDT8395829.1 regulatory protein RecX [bacterium]